MESRKTYTVRETGGSDAARTLAALFMCALVGAGCGGGGGGGGGGTGSTGAAGGDATERVLTYGPVTTRVVGTVQAPVVSTSTGAAVTGVAGATVSDLTVGLPVGGNRIVWDGQRGGAQQILIAEPGRSETALTNSVGNDGNFGPQFSPDGGRVAWYGRRGGATQILVKSADGTGAELALTNSPVGDDNFLPRWSPDGRKVIYVGFRAGASQILLRNADGSGPEIALTNDPPGNGNGAAQFSPDGSRIVWHGIRNGARQILVKNADGSGSELAVTNSPAGENNVQPAWSPDGRKIAWAGVRNSVAQILVKNADGSGAENVLTTSPGQNLAPRWSPDGTRILWYGDRGGVYQILIGNADGGGELALTSSPPGSDNTNPQWAPDGHAVVWQGIRGGVSRILFSNLESGGGESGFPSSATDQGSNADPQLSNTFAVRTTHMVGANGVLGNAAAGFLLGQQGTAVVSLVAFDAATAAGRANVRVQALTGPDSASPNLLFSITSADALSSLRYVTAGKGQNGSRFYPATSVIGPGGGTLTATGALVSFDGADGNVSLVIPYTANRSVGGNGSRATERSGDVVTLRGRFPAVFEGTGKNIAPDGATEVRINARTGVILSVR